MLRIDVDPTKPGAFGMPSSTAAYFAESRAFETDEPSVVTLARYAPADRLLMSGWLLGADRLGGRQAVLDVPLGNGHVIAVRVPATLPRPVTRDVQAAVQCAAR